MTSETFEIDGLILIKPKVFEDSRGFFVETFHKTRFENLGINTSFLQDNLSKSNRGVLRGLHFQKPPFDQGKLIQVIQGSVLDIAVDIRKNSPTYGQHLSIEINSTNKWQLFIPSGFAHGFLCLEDNTIFSYKCTNLYHKESEGAIIWNDQDLNINWNFENPIISDKDKVAEKFNQFNSPF